MTTKDNSALAISELWLSFDPMKHKVNLKKTDEGYAVWVPGLPGCWSQGKTEEALDNIKDAIQAYLETREMHYHDQRRESSSDPAESPGIWPSRPNSAIIKVR